MLTKEDKKNRTGKVGSSDVLTVLGLNPYETEYEYVSRWLGLLPEKEVTPPMLAGNVFEGPIAGFYMKLSGKVITPACGTTYVHPDYPWKISHPDYFDDYGNPVEIKNVGAYSAHLWGPDGSDEVPLGPLCQVIDQTTLTKRNKAIVVAYFGGADLRVYPLKISEEVKEKQLKRVVAFYERYLEPGILPPVTGRDVSILNEVYRGDEPVDKQADSKVLDAVKKYKYYKAQTEECKKLVDEASAEIKEFMGEATRLVESDVPILAWSRNKDSEKLDYKGLIKHLDVDDHIIHQFTEKRLGARPLRILNVKKEETNE